jgi:hypothetical protein
MAELGLYALGSLLGLGALLKSTGPSTNLSSFIGQHNESTTGSNIYHSRDYFKHKETEQARANKNFGSSLAQGIVPMYYNTLEVKSDLQKIPNPDYNKSMIFKVVEKQLDPQFRRIVEKKGTAIHDADRNLNSELGIVMDHPSRPQAVGHGQENALDQIGGKLIPTRSGEKEDFSHNNMVPFYKGSLTQDIRSENRAKQGKLELYTGQMKLNRQQKKECALRFTPSKYVTAVYGTSVNGQHRDLDRYKPNNTGKDNNALPFQQLRVGPGLNDGFTARPSGGFHNTVRIMPKSIEELRVDPVLENKARVKTGGSYVSKRPLTPQLYHYRPKILVNNQNGERNFTTTGATIARRARPNIILKDTNRKYSRFLINHAKSVGAGKPMAIPKSRVSRRKNHFNTPHRNLAGNVSDRRTNDYGRSGFQAHPTNRQTTGLKRHIIAPGGDYRKNRAVPQDRARKTRKQHYIHHPRQYGNLDPQKPSRGISYNPSEWAARTTIKETTENGDHLGISRMIGGGRGTSYDPQNWAARTTIKETTENGDHLGISRMIGGGRGTSYDPQNWAARTTVKETTEDNRHLGPVSTLEKRQVAYDPKNWSARTTIKETTLNETERLGPATLERRQVAYDPQTWAARTTVKETTLRDHEHLGAASGQKQSRAYNPAEWKAKTTVKETTLRDSEHLGVATGRKAGGGYATSEWYANNTNRQFTGDHEYVGVANSSVRKSKSYDSAYNARFNENKERVSKRRAPKGAGPSLGPQYINNMESKKMDDDRLLGYVNSKGSNVGNVYNPNAIVFTSEKNHLPQHDIRLDPAILDAYKHNPLTQSLHSY